MPAICTGKQSLGVGTGRDGLTKQSSMGDVTWRLKALRTMVVVENLRLGLWHGWLLTLYIVRIPLSLPLVTGIESWDRALQY